MLSVILVSVMINELKILTSAELKENLVQLITYWILGPMLFACLFGLVFPLQCLLKSYEEMFSNLAAHCYLSEVYKTCQMGKILAQATFEVPLGGFNTDGAKVGLQFTVGK